MEITPPLHKVNYDTLINAATAGQLDSVLRATIAELLEEVEREEPNTSDYNTGKSAKAEETLELIYYTLKNN